MSASPAPRIRVFAGPNGSGKSTLLQRLTEIGLPMYHIINPDDIERSLTSKDGLDLSFLGRAATKQAFRKHVRKSTYSAIAKKAARGIVMQRSVMFSRRTHEGSYNAALVASFIREALLTRRASFSFESVFSHPSKVDELDKAVRKGYRIYLYYVATDTPELGIGRIRERVAKGGHSVPAAKVRSRHIHSLQNLYPALELAYRAYFFDNSGKEARLIAERTTNGNLKLETEHIPVWFAEHALSHLGFDLE